MINKCKIAAGNHFSWGTYHYNRPILNELVLLFHGLSLKKLKFKKG